MFARLCSPLMFQLVTLLQMVQAQVLVLYDTLGPWKWVSLRFCLLITKKQQYQDAIKSHKAGKPVDYEELPTPPGYAPIPGVAAPEDEPAENFSVPEVKCK